jgi:DNA primase
VVALKFRCLRHEDCKAEGCQRYDAPSGQKAKLYGAGDLANGGDVAAVVEGEFKAIAVAQELGIPAVGTSAGQWLEHWPRTLADFERVLVIADNDDAGVKHAKDKVLKTLPQGRLIVPPIEYPKVDDWLAGVGTDEVRKAIGL